MNYKMWFVNYLDDNVYTIYFKKCYKDQPIVAFDLQNWLFKSRGTLKICNVWNKFAHINPWDYTQKMYCNPQNRLNVLKEPLPQHVKCILQSPRSYPLLCYIRANKFELSINLFSDLKKKMTTHFIRKKISVIQINLHSQDTRITNT